MESSTEMEFCKSDVLIYISPFCYTKVILRYYTGFKVSERKAKQYSTAIREIPDALKIIRWTSFVASLFEVPSPLAAVLTEELLILKIAMGIVVFSYCTWFSRYIVLTNNDYQGDKLALVVFYILALMLCFLLNEDLIPVVLDVMRIMSAVVMIAESFLPWCFDWSVLGRDVRAAVLSTIECVAEFSVNAVVQNEISSLEEGSRIFYLASFVVFVISYTMKRFWK